MTDSTNASSADNKRLTPVDLKVMLGRRALHIKWADGSEFAYPFAVLRRMCPCATCRSEREKPRTSLPILKTAGPDPLRVTGASLVGRYAVKLVWSDGHDTGIFDFSYLRSLEPGIPSESAKPPTQA